LNSSLGGDPSLEIEAADAGMHRIAGERMPVQIVETKSLAEEENLWLYALRSGLEQATLRRMVDESKRHGSRISAYVYAVLGANETVLIGDMEMSLARRMQLAHVLDAIRGSPIYLISGQIAD